MTSPIKPPSGPPRPLDGLTPDVSASADGARSTDVSRGDAFKATLEGVSQDRPTVGAGEAAGTRATDLGASLRAGEITPEQALDVLVTEALASADAQKLEPAARVELEQHLRTMLAEDPSLQALVGDLSRT